MPVDSRLLPYFAASRAHIYGEARSRCTIVKTAGAFAIVFALALATVMAQQEIVRKELGTANIGPRTISRVDVREIVFEPGQKPGLHRHPCPIICYVVEGTIRFGQKAEIIPAGHICYEPAEAIIDQFDNASDSAEAKFIAYYLLNGQKELIEMLPDKNAAR